MKIKIVTDSTADLPADLARELDITVVPAYVHFGREVFRDRVDISEDEFYRRLTADSLHPTTSPPTPHDFADTYLKLSHQADGIISIHISSKLSSTCNSALRAREIVAEACAVEVVDSQAVTMGTGLLTVAAAKLAANQNDLSQLTAQIRALVPDVRLLGLLDTLKYLALGGRLGRVKAFVGSIMSVKPILAIRDGELEPAEQVRNREKGLNRLVDFVKGAGDIQDLAVIHSTTPDEAGAIADRLGDMFPRERIRLARLGPVLGVHGGPGIMFVALLGSKN